ncbi:MAG: hypothetical protein K0U93_07600 [Gammaproteobacteria bacterium]|nr:hypothetical protein [Gammaproteobacteria bacterium]
MVFDESLLLAGVGVFLGGYVLAHLVVSLVGRRVCRRFAAVLPSEYERLGKPLPSLWVSARFVAYNRLLFRKEYLQLGDPMLVRQFAALRPWELALFATLVFGFVVLGLVFVWLHWFA